MSDFIKIRLSEKGNIEVKIILISPSFNVMQKMSYNSKLLKFAPFMLKIFYILQAS